ncbi:MAG: lysine biosynthesis protein LysW [Thaumarchaeota archaeon]|nr:lysine biosynthesis protein LysW [Nitrososphaerota archaeon]
MNETINCPECDAVLVIPADAIQGEVVSCKDCGTSYEIVRDKETGALSIRPAELEEEDWGE